MPTRSKKAPTHSAPGSRAAKPVLKPASRGRAKEVEDGDGDEQAEWTASSEDERPDGERTPNDEYAYATVRLTMPRWFLRQIDDEAKLLGYRRRTEFLAMLVRRQAGIFPLQRPPHAPKVKAPEPSEIGPDERYIWNCPQDARALLEDMCARMGRVSPKAVMMMLLFDYLGLPLMQTPQVSK